MAVTYTYTKKINTYNGSNVVSGKYTLKLVITFTKLSTNYTRLKMVGYIKSNDSSYYSYNLNAGAKNILKISNEDGTIQYSKTFYADYDTRNTGTYSKMFTKTVDLKHGSDGARSVRFIWTFNDRALPGWRPNGTLYAPSSTSRIKLTTTTYTVKFNANGGTGAPSSQTKTHGQALTLSSTKPTRTSDDSNISYRFVGWSTSASATTAKWKAGGTYTTNASDTLYAVWSTSVNSYDVVYDANGGSGAPSKQTKTAGTALTLSSIVPTRSGYTFAGWNTKQDGSGTTYSAGSSYTTDDDLILYAMWTAWSHTVEYNANGGTGTPSGFTISTGEEAYTVDAVVFETDTGSEETEVEEGTGDVETETDDADTVGTAVTRDGYVFRCWNTASDGSGTTYYPGDVYNTVKNGGTVTLYAIWIAETILLCNDSSCKCIEFKEGGNTAFINGGVVSAAEFIEGSSMTLGSSSFTFSELIEK